MAERDGVIFKYKYIDYINILGIPDADAWELIQGMVEYSKTKKIPVFKNQKVTGLFAAIKYEIDHPEGIPSGDNHWNWKGGITPKVKSIRSSTEYRHWRKKVFYRDNYTCQICNKKNVKLRAHHKKSFSDFPELRFDICNGLTLCEECHVTLHKGKTNG